MKKIIDIVDQTRSIRRFDQSKKVTTNQLKYLVEVARLTASARNTQPLKYVTITDEKLCNEIFNATGWAGALLDGRPKDGEQPTGYVLIFQDKSIAANSLWDQGIVSYSMMMAATEQGLGGCIIATIFRDKFPDLGLRDDLEPALVLAIGYPNEEIRIVDVPESGSTTYYRDENQVHYVPKRELGDILLREI